MLLPFVLSPPLSRYFYFDTSGYVRIGDHGSGAHTLSVPQPHGTANLTGMDASAPFRAEVRRRQPHCKVQRGATLSCRQIIRPDKAPRQVHRSLHLLPAASEHQRHFQLAGV